MNNQPTASSRLSTVKAAKIWPILWKVNLSCWLLLGADALQAAQIGVGAPGTRASSVEQVESALRLGLFPQVIEGCRLLLSTNSMAPVQGIFAVASSAMEDLAQATNSILRALRANEPRARLHSLQVQAIIHRLAQKMEAATNACALAMREDPNHPLNQLIMGQIHYDLRAYDQSASYASAAIGLEPNLSLAHTVLGMARQAQGRPNDALASFARAKDLDPSDLRPRVGMAEVFLGARMWPATITLCREVLILNPSLLVVREMLMTALLESGLPGEAATEARTILATRPNSASASYALSRAHAQMNDFPSATVQLRHFLSVKTNAPAGWYLMGLCLLAQDKLEEAKDALKAAAGSNAGNVGALAALGVVEHVSGSYRAASNYFGQALTQPNPEWQERVQFLLGNLRISEKDWAGAKKHFAQASGFFPNARIDSLDLERFYHNAPGSSAALVNSAILFLTEGLPDRAIRAYRESLKKAPSNVIALFLSSNALARKLDYVEALEALNKLIRLVPGYAPAYFAMGEICNSRKSPDEALAAYSKAIELDGDFGLPYLRLGVLHQAKNQVQAAETMYRQAIRLLPDSPFAYNEVANMLAEREQNLDEALALAQRAVQISPKNGAILDTLGWVYFKRAEFAQAVGAFQTSLQSSLDPALIPTVRYHLGLAYTKTGSSAKALAEFQAALQLAPEMSQAAEINVLIQALRPR